MENIKINVRLRNYQSLTKIPPVWVVNNSTQSLSLKQEYQKECKGNSNVHHYQFDQCFDVLSTNNSVYQQSVKSIINSSVKGINSTIFAYGPTVLLKVKGKWKNIYNARPK